MLELARRDAQELHKKISDNIAKAEHATWAEVKAVQADINALGLKMKAVSEDQSDTAKAGIKTAIGKLEAAGQLVGGNAVATARTKLARSIEPKKLFV